MIHVHDRLGGERERDGDRDGEIERERERERERRERNLKELMGALKLLCMHKCIHTPTLSPLKIAPYLAMQMWLERSRERFLVR